MLTLQLANGHFSTQGSSMNKIPLYLPGEAITTLRTMIIMNLSSITDMMHKVKINLL